MKDIWTWIKANSSTVVLIGSVSYGAFTFLHNRENRINSAITKERVDTIILNVREDFSGLLNVAIDSMKASQLRSSRIALSGINKLDRKLTTFSNEFIIHIKKQTDISDPQKIDDILRLVQGLSDEKKN